MWTELAAAGHGMFDERSLAFLHACEDEADRFPGKIYGNKITTEQLYRLEEHNAANPGAPVDVLDGFLNRHMKGRKVVFVLRDRRTCVRSKVRRTGQSVELACDRWRYSVRVWQFLGSRHADNIRIRFEDLLIRPDETLTAVCAFLGIRYDASMLCGTQSAKMLPAYKQERLDASKLDLVDLPIGCVERIQDELRLCGYL